MLASNPIQDALASIIGLFVLLGPITAIVFILFIKHHPNRIQPFKELSVFYVTSFSVFLAVFSLFTTSLLRWVDILYVFIFVIIAYPITRFSGRGGGLKAWSISTTILCEVFLVPVILLLGGLFSGKLSTLLSMTGLSNQSSISEILLLLFIPIATPVFWWLTIGKWIEQKHPKQPLIPPAPPVAIPSVEEDAVSKVFSTSFEETEAVAK